MAEEKKRKREAKEEKVSKKHKDESKSKDEKKKVKGEKIEETKNVGVNLNKNKLIANTLAERYERRLKAIDLIAQPLASKDVSQLLYETIRSGAQAKVLSRGVSEVVKSLRKGKKGFVVLAGDISPIDVITHIPVLCEENNVPYIYVPSKEDLGISGATKRPSSCILVTDKLESVSGADKLYKSCLDKIKPLHAKLIAV